SLASPFPFLFTHTAPTSIYTLSLHDALPISRPVHVVPHIARPSGDVEAARFDRIGDRYLFYVIGAWSTRKAMAETVGAFLDAFRSEEHTSELQSQSNLVCRLLLEKKKKKNIK